MKPMVDSIIASENVSAPVKPGILVVLEGTDGSGKKTQSIAVVKLLNDLGYPAERIEFPQYGTRSAALVEDYLNGKYGTADEVGPHIASLFYACDRYDASFKIRKLLSEGCIVVCDRYTSSNMGHQASKISDHKTRDEFFKWLEDLEFGLFKIPRPDLTIYLYMPPAIGQNLVGKKSLRAYITDGTHDIHEKDINHLSRSAEAYMYVAKKFGWTVIKCADEKSPYQVNVITKDVMREIAKSLDVNASLTSYLNASETI